MMLFSIHFPSLITLIDQRADNYNQEISLARIRVLIYASWEVQFGQRVAWSAIVLTQKGQFLVDGAGSAPGCRLNRFTCRIRRKMANATIRKSKTVCRKIP
jgi:hypothetical protein